MLTNLLCRNSVALTLALLGGCAVTLPPAPVMDPSNPGAPEAAAEPFRPHLNATSRTFLSPKAGDREEEMAHPMEMSEKPVPAGTRAYYTCVMHPEIREAKPGDCPLCGMTLIKQTDAPEAKP